MTKNNLGILNVKFSTTDLDENNRITLHSAKEKHLDGLVELIEKHQ